MGKRKTTFVGEIEEEKKVSHEPKVVKEEEKVEEKPAEEKPAGETPAGEKPATDAKAAWASR